LVENPVYLLLEKKGKDEKRKRRGKVEKVENEQ